MSWVWREGVIVLNLETMRVNLTYQERFEMFVHGGCVAFVQAYLKSNRVDPNGKLTQKGFQIGTLGFTYSIETLLINVAVTEWDKATNEQAKENYFKIVMELIEHGATPTDLVRMLLSR